MKLCLHCNQLKPLSDFFDNPRTRDGKGSYCRNCEKVLQRERRAKRGMKRLAHDCTYRFGFCIVCRNLKRRREWNSVRRYVMA